MGWLLICNPPHKTAAEIGKALEMSKGSVSTMTRLLIQMGLIEKFGRIGERQYFYRIHPHALEQMMFNRMAEFARLGELANQGLALIEKDSTADRRRLLQIDEVCDIITTEMPPMIAQISAAEQKYAAMEGELDAESNPDQIESERYPEM